MNENEISGNTLPLQDVIDRILTNQGMDNALNYEYGIEDVAEDKVILLCTSESGKYEAFGFVSPEYGTIGILLIILLMVKVTGTIFMQTGHTE